MSILERESKREPGFTIRNHLDVFANELDDIGFGLGSIVTSGRWGFGLEGDDLVEFVRLCLMRLEALGVSPHHAGSLDQGDRFIKLDYGPQPGAMTAGILKEWIDLGMPTPKWGDYWFSWPGYENYLDAWDRPERQRRDGIEP